MPNPLSRVNPDASIGLGPGALMQRADLVHWIADIVTAWPHLEAQLGRSLAKFLGTQANLGVAIYTGLTSTVMQKAVVEKAAKAALSGEDLEVFNLLLKRTVAAAKERRNIAHGIWGYSHEVPDALLCVEPGMQLSVIANLDLLFVPGALKEFPQHDPSRIQVYTEADFDRIFQGIYRIVNQFELFWRMVKADPPVRDRLLAALRREPPDQKETVELLTDPTTR